jgi:hypothetical protein
MTEGSEQQRQPTEEELRAALEEEMRRVTVDDVLLQSAVSLVNLGGRKAGLAPGTEGERDVAQVQAAIDGVSALLPVLEARGREEVKPIRDALSQLQMAYARLAGEAAAPPAGEAPAGDKEAAAEPGADQGKGPAQSSGRLWVPGQ